MISSEEEYLDAMRDMIRKVQQGYEPPFTADAEELEIFSDCIRQGYLIGKTTYIDRNGVEQELRTMDGKMHAELINHVIPPKGLAFLAEGAEKGTADDDEKHDSLFKKFLYSLKISVKVAWALFAGFSVIVTVLGWPLILRFLTFLCSLF